jgi:phage terminase small subunit
VRGGWVGGVDDWNGEMTKPNWKPLTRKQLVFVAEYLKCWNASEAARLAGYSAKTAYAIGSRLLRNVEVKAAIDAAVEQIQMSANEALIRNTQVGRGDLGDFFQVVDEWTFYPLPTSEILEYKEVDENEGKEDEEPKIRTSYRVRRVILDVDKLVDPRFSHLVKKFTDSPKNGLGIELYDAQKARRTVLEKEGKLKQRVEVSGKDGEPLEVVFRYAQSGNNPTTIAPKTDTNQDGEKAP